MHKLREKGDVCARGMKCRQDKKRKTMAFIYYFLTLCSPGVVCARPSQRLNAFVLFIYRYPKLKIQSHRAVPLIHARRVNRRDKVRSRLFEGFASHLIQTDTHKQCSPQTKQQRFSLESSERFTASRNNSMIPFPTTPLKIDKSYFFPLLHLSDTNPKLEFGKCNRESPCFSYLEGENKSVGMDTWDSPKMSRMSMMILSLPTTIVCTWTRT